MIRWAIALALSTGAYGLVVDVFVPRGWGFGAFMVTWIAAFMASAALNWTKAHP